MLLLCVPVEISALEHKGNEPIEKELLLETIEAALYNTGLEKYSILLLETAAAESRLGHFNVSYALKGQYGIFQITSLTAKDTLAWLKKKNFSLYDKIEQRSYKTEDILYNLKYNVEYGACIAALIYYRMAPNAKIGTREERARVWKRIYNSSLGSGTEQGYLIRCKECLDVKMD